MTAEERAVALVDRGTFTWINRQYAEKAGVVTGWGMVDERPVVVTSQDAAIASGAIGTALADAVQSAQRFAIDHATLQADHEDDREPQLIQLSPRAPRADD